MGAARDAVALVALADNSSYQKDRADCVAEADFSFGAEIVHGVIQEKRDADDERSGADFIQPICAEALFHVGPIASWLRSGFGFGAESRRAKQLWWRRDRWSWHQWRCGRRGNTWNCGLGLARGR